MVGCGKCGSPAIIFQDYSGMYLCEEHFLESVEKKVKRHIRKHYPVVNGERIGVALSGGKDSVVSLHLMDEIFGDWPDLELVALSVDEGISGYRDEALGFARRAAGKRGLKVFEYGFKEETGFSLDEVAEIDGEEEACSICGILRKWIINRKAKELSLDKVVVGHNLDDVAQSVLMNVLRGESNRLSRLGASFSSKKGFVPRIKPLREVPEDEVGFYVELCDEVEAHFGSCPYSEWAFRGEVMSFLNDFEERHPGAKYSVVRSVDKIEKVLSEGLDSPELDRCSCCSEPTEEGVCQACEVLEKLRQKVQV